MAPASPSQGVNTGVSMPPPPRQQHGYDGQQQPQHHHQQQLLAHQQMHLRAQVPVASPVDMKPRQGRALLAQPPPFPQMRQQASGGGGVSEAPISVNTDTISRLWLDDASEDAGARVVAAPATAAAPANGGSSVHSPSARLSPPPAGSDTPHNVSFGSATSADDLNTSSSLWRMGSQQTPRSRSLPPSQLSSAWSSRASSPVGGLNTTSTVSAASSAADNLWSVGVSLSAASAAIGERAQKEPSSVPTEPSSTWGSEHHELNQSGQQLRQHHQQGAGLSSCGMSGDDLASDEAMLRLACDLHKLSA